MQPFAAALRERVAPAFSAGAFGYDPCHDAFHLDRVARNAEYIARAEGADVSVVTSAAFLHDLDRSGEKDPLGAARAHLVAVGAPLQFQDRVLEVVERHKDKSFQAGGVRARSLEARVLSDADKLEAIGAIGIARTFSYGGLKQRPLWDGPERTDESPENLIESLAARGAEKLYVSGANGSTVDHFFEKLLRLQGDFVTPTGQSLAAERHVFLKTFLAAFFDEWFAVEPSKSA